MKYFDVSTMSMLLVIFVCAKEIYKQTYLRLMRERRALVKEIEKIDQQLFGEN